LANNNVNHTWVGCSSLVEITNPEPQTEGGAHARDSDSWTCHRSVDQLSPKGFIKDVKFDQIKARIILIDTLCTAGNHHPLIYGATTKDFHEKKTLRLGRAAPMSAGPVSFVHWWKYATLEQFQSRIFHAGSSVSGAATSSFQKNKQTKKLQQFSLTEFVLLAGNGSTPNIHRRETANQSTRGALSSFSVLESLGKRGLF
jgi:hypothetical protein